MIIGNWLAFCFVVACFGAASGVMHFAGNTSEAAWMIIAGPLLAACDIGYRSRYEGGRLFARNGGAVLFGLPAWLWGLFWLVLGGFDAITGRR